MRNAVITVIIITLIFLQSAFSAAQVLSPKELSAAKKAELNDTEWTIEVKPMDGSARTDTDVLSFSEGKITSQNLKDAGYAATDFTVRVKEDETVIWETMQTDGNDNFAFWRGDIKDGVMRGVLSKRDRRGRTSDFSFASQLGI